MYIYNFSFKDSKILIHVKQYVDSLWFTKNNDNKLN